MKICLDCRHDRYTLRALADRVSASGPCLRRLDRGAGGREFPAAHRGSGQGQARRRIRRRDLRGSGLAGTCPGTSRCCASRRALRRLPRSAGAAASRSPIPVSAPARRSPRKSRARPKHRTLILCPLRGRGRTARFIPAPAAIFPMDERAARIAGGESYALRLDAAKAAAAAGPAHLPRAWPCPCGRSAVVRRRGAGAQGCAGCLSSGGGGGRCLPGRDPGDARRRSAARRPCAAPVAGAAGLSRTGLCPSPPDPGRGWAQILQARSGRDLAGLAREEGVTPAGVEALF